jgi:transglutaminase-like putative cysteine protease
MQYLVRHLTRFSYTSPVSESVMELRMQPLNDDRQRCLRFDVVTAPRARVFAYRDHVGNAVHYFDIPAHHTRLDITAETVVDVAPTRPLPEALPADAWTALDALAAGGEAADWLAPSRFAVETPALKQFAGAIGLGGRDRDPLTLLRQLTVKLYEELAYEPRTTNVDSPIDEALEARAGVCQDFAHIMTALCRSLGVPCRYVSGYLAPADPETGHDRSAEHATHAWVEALLPELGWVGFDPTNNTLARERHIAVAFGRDYGDVPPTRGVFKGDGSSDLGVAVSVTRAEYPVAQQDLVPSVSLITQVRSAQARDAENFYQQQQQQQQCRMIGR